MYKKEVVMKKLVNSIGVVAACLVAGSGTAHAQGMMGYPQISPDASTATTVQEIVSGIMAAQGVQSRDAIDCTKISRDTLDKLGDGLMDYYHPGSAHEVMDAMMGGEGSSALEAMHVGMGEAYLGCRGDVVGDETVNPPTARIVAENVSPSWGMSAGWSYVPWIIAAEVVVLLAVLVRYMWIKGSHEQRKH